MDYSIETEFQGPGFVAVPNAVAQSDLLSAEALGVLVWMASLPTGHILRVSSIRERFGFGKDKWQRIARELRDAGALANEPQRCRAGRVLFWRVIVRWPEIVEKPTSRKTRPVVHKPEKPASGKPAKYSRKTRQVGPENPAPYKEERTKKEPAALNLDDLGRYAASCLWAGNPVTCSDGSKLQPNDPRYKELQRQLKERA